ncbi:MAG: hypothetical protein VW547_12015 [Alphaproteobacteria bacterium]
MRHYAEGTIKPRCAGQPNAAGLYALFVALADAEETAALPARKADASD